MPLIQPMPSSALDADRYKELKIKPVRTLTSIEAKLLERQEQFDKGNFGFFTVYLTEGQCHIVEAFKSYNEVIIEGGVRSNKTFGMVYCTLCRLGNFYPIGYVPYRTMYGDTIWRPILEKKVLPDTNPVAKVWFSVVTRPLGAAPYGLQDTFMKLLPRPWLKGKHTVGGIYITSVDLTNGAVLEIKSSDAGREAYQSATLDLFVADEGQPVEVIDEATSRSGSYPLKFIYGYYPIPEEGRTWMRDRYIVPELEHRSPPFRKVLKVNYLENAFIPKPKKDEQIERWIANHEFNERVYGDFGEIKGLVYKQFKRSTHVMNAMDIPAFVPYGGEPPDHWKRFCAIDTHNSRKGCAAVMCAIDPATGRRYYYNEYQSSGDPHTWFEYFNKIHHEHPFEMVWIDPSAFSPDAFGFSIGDKFMEMTDLPLEKAFRDRAQGIHAVTLGLNPLHTPDNHEVDGLPGIIICEHCYTTIRQMESYARKSDVFNDVIKVNDEYCDCIRYIEVQEPQTFFGASYFNDDVSALEPDDDYLFNPNLRTV